MSSRFFTNNETNTLLKKFEGIFEHNPDLARFDALVGYLRASGYFAIRPNLGKVPVVRILVGINVDNIVEEYHKKGQLFLADAGKALKEFRAIGVCYWGQSFRIDFLICQLKISIRKDRGRNGYC